MVDGRALPIEVGWTVCRAIIEEHYEPELARRRRLNEADKSTMVPQADAAALPDHERYRRPLPCLAAHRTPLGQP
jgi:hypothetical protein